MLEKGEINFNVQVTYIKKNVCPLETVFKFFFNTPIPSTLILGSAQVSCVFLSLYSDICLDSIFWAPEQVIPNLRSVITIDWKNCYISTFLTYVYE